MNCLFCNKNGPYNTIEHIVPESLGNKRLLLIEQICDSCQAYLGKEVERYVLQRSPIGAWRVFAGIETKNGKPPTFSFRQPNRNKGHLPDSHFANDDTISLSISEEGEHEFDIEDEQVLKAVADGTKTEFRLVLTPKMLHMMGRFLGKVGLEILARDHPDFARSDSFDKMRRFVRFGEPIAFLWPIFYGSKGASPAISPCEILVMDSNAEHNCPYTLCIFVLGNEHWITCLNDPYPPPDIRKSFPDIALKLITY
jgi:hypothetical protein